MTAINMHDDTFDGISQFRFVQRKRGELEFQYIPDCQHPDIQRVQTRLQEKLGSIFTLRCQSVTSISKTTRGKHTFLEQKLEEL
jgi:hypothetical protein